MVCSLCSLDQWFSTWVDIDLWQHRDDTKSPSREKGKKFGYGFSALANQTDKTKIENTRPSLLLKITWDKFLVDLRIFYFSNVLIILFFNSLIRSVIDIEPCGSNGEYY